MTPYMGLILSGAENCQGVLSRCLGCHLFGVGPITFGDKLLIPCVGRGCFRDPPVADFLQRGFVGYRLPFSLGFPSPNRAASPAPAEFLRGLRPVQ